MKKQRKEGIIPGKADTKKGKGRKKREGRGRVRRGKMKGVENFKKAFQLHRILAS